MARVSAELLLRQLRDGMNQLRARMEVDEVNRQQWMNQWSSLRESLCNLKAQEVEFITVERSQSGAHEVFDEISFGNSAETRTEQLMYMPPVVSEGHAFEVLDDKHHKNIVFDEQKTITSLDTDGVLTHSNSFAHASELGVSFAGEVFVKMQNKVVWDEDKPSVLDTHEDLLQQLATGEEYIVDKDSKTIVEPVNVVPTHESNTPVLFDLGMEAMEHVFDEMSSVDIVWDEDIASDIGMHDTFLRQIAQGVEYFDGEKINPDGGQVSENSSGFIEFGLFDGDHVFVEEFGEDNKLVSEASRELTLERDNPFLLGFGMHYVSLGMHGYLPFAFEAHDNLLQKSACEREVFDYEIRNDIAGLVFEDVHSNVAISHLGIDSDMQLSDQALKSELFVKCEIDDARLLLDKRPSFSGFGECSNVTGYMLEKMPAWKCNGFSPGEGEQQKVVVEPNLIHMISDLIIGFMSMCARQSSVQFSLMQLKLLVLLLQNTLFTVLRIYWALRLYSDTQNIVIMVVTVSQKMMHVDMEICEPETRTQRHHQQSYLLIALEITLCLRSISSNSYSQEYVPGSCAEITETPSATQFADCIAIASEWINFQLIPFDFRKDFEEAVAAALFKAQNQWQQCREIKEALLVILVIIRPVETTERRKVLLQ